MRIEHFTILYLWLAAAYVLLISDLEITKKSPAVTDVVLALLWPGVLVFCFVYGSVRGWMKRHDN